ncbi:hypothetical protein GMB70_15125 [Turicibacter sanguinis]|nr:hypothetical protein [Turicibacter sanguinis]
MCKVDFYTIFNYGTESENFVKRKGHRYKLENGVVIFITEDFGGWTSTEETTGSCIVVNAKTRSECLNKTVEQSDSILNALKSEFNIKKAERMKYLIAKGEYEIWI